MPILSGPVSSIRFRVYGELPETASQWEDALASCWFRPPLSPTVKRASGFCVLTRPLGETHDINDWAFNHYMLFGWRIDEKKVDGRRFKAELAERIKVWCAANNRPRCPAAVREELKEMLEMELLQGMKPSLRVIGVLVNVDKGYVLLDSSNTAIVEEITKVFHRELGVRLVEDGHAGESILGAPTPAFPALFASFDPRSGSVLPGAESVALEVAPNRFSGTALSGFFAWLWGHGQTGNDQMVLADGIAVSFAIVDEARFASRAATHDEVVVRLQDPSGSAEARAAVKADRVPTSIRLFLRREDREYTMALSGPSLSISALKLSQMVKSGDTAEVLYDRMFLYEELVWILEALVELYIAEALTPEGRAGMKARWMEWLGEGEAAGGDGAGDGAGGDGKEDEDGWEEA